MDLYKVAHNFVMENFADVVTEHSTEFLDLSFDELKKLLSSGNTP